MSKELPARPNLDHLRRQAKALLAALAKGDPQAVQTLQDHLPSAQSMSADEIRRTSFRLADAQSAIARKTGFASWPQLARHVDQLRALEGTWTIASLELDGKQMPRAMATASRVLIDGDRFRTETPEATYEGIFNINVEAEPHEIDIEFVAGPEAGNWNYGIFRVTSDQLEICLDMNGKPRPAQFRTTAGSGHAYERLSRTSTARPEEVTGGAPPACQTLSGADRSKFDFVESALLMRLQGDWKAVQIVRDGQSLPTFVIATALRSAARNEVKITFGGQVMIHALVRLDESSNPIHVDYFNLCGEIGTVQQGIMKWIGDEACFNMASPGQPRPADFTCPPGSGRTLSRWRAKS